MAPKKKANKLAFGDFLADSSYGGSWADEMDDLPTAPASRGPDDPAGSGLGGSHLSRFDNNNRYGDRDQNRRGGDRDRDYDRPPRNELPVPDKAPFNAFVGNLSWEVSNNDLEQFFGTAHLISIRMMNDSVTGKPKGYGYIEFDDRDALIAALDKSGREVGGRVIRVSVAEPPKEKEDRTGGAWRREGPLPSLNGRSRNLSSNGFERASMDEDRGERMGFGSKFVPSTNSTGLGPRSQSGRGFSRGGGEGAENEGDNVDRGARMGFGSKFVPSVDEPRRDREPPRRGASFVPSRGTPAGSDDGHSVSGGSGKRQAFGDRKPSESALTPADTVSTWRSTRSPNVSADRETASPSSTLPPTRRKLELSARTASPSDGALTPPQSHSANASGKPSPFGSAKPVDSTEREKAIQEKLEQRERGERSALVAKKAVGFSNKPSLETLSRQNNEETASVASTEAAPSPPSAPKAPKPNPFGEAKPVNTLQKEMEIEEKREKEKEQREKKMRKEAEEAKLSSSLKPDSSAPTEAFKETAASRPVPPSSSSVNTPSSKTTSSTWRSSGGEKVIIANGKLAPTPAPVHVATAQDSNEPSPKSPNLSSFRKEGVSFAALAKAANASSPTQPTKPSTGPEEPRSKLSSQVPRTILKRPNGVSLQNQ